MLLHARPGLSARAKEGDRRDETARLRDANADVRDRAADARDRTAGLREEAFLADDRSLEATIRALLEASDVARGSAAADRAGAAGDRARAADDRVSAGLDGGRGRGELEHGQLDDLTGVYMREIGIAALEAEIDRSRRSEEPFVLASVDVDGLKALNDAQGYAAGDALLRSVVSVLWSKLRSYDTIVRVGGDRFLCGLSNTEIGAARRRAEEMRSAVAEIRAATHGGLGSVAVGLASLAPAEELADLTTRANADMVSHKGAARATRPPPPSGPTAPRLSIVIPTLNEAVNLPHVLATLPDGLHEVIVVDGFSTDDTIGIAQRLRPDVRIVSQERRGKGNALACGFRASTGDVIVMLDADGSADPSEIPAFVSALVAGADFAKGSRFLAGGGGSADITRLRHAGNLVLNGIVNTLYGTDYTDLCYGYNAFWRHCLPVLDVDCDGFEVETMINCRIAKAGLSVTEVPSFESARIHGHSNLHTVSDGARVLRTLLREWVRRTPAPVTVPASNGGLTTTVSSASSVDSGSTERDVSAARPVRSRPA